MDQVSPRLNKKAAIPTKEVALIIIEKVIQKVGSISTDIAIRYYKFRSTY